MVVEMVFEPPYLCLRHLYGTGIRTCFSTRFAHKIRDVAQKPHKQTMPLLAQI